MTPTEVIMLIQAIIMLATGAVIVWYTIETKRLRTTAVGQFEVMQGSLALQIEEMKRAAEPIFVWGGGSASGDHVQWDFRNEGGPISYLTITMRSPTGAAIAVQPKIRPSEWLGTSSSGVVTFDGEVAGELLFSIGFRTRLGGIGSFFFSASRSSKPLLTGSGWV